MAIYTNKVEKIRAIGDHVLVSDMGFTERLTQNGIIILNDNGKAEGIRPRWGRVYAVGPLQEDVQVGQWVCVAHGRWTRGVEIERADGTKDTIRRVDTNDILLVSDEEPQDETMSTAILA